MFIQCVNYLPKPTSSSQQSGAVLPVALIMMLLMTLIGASGARVSGLDEKMAGNMKDRNLAFQAAESALRAGEAAVAVVNIAACPAAPANPTGFYHIRDADCDGNQETTQIWESIDWDTQSVVFNGTLAEIGSNPRYIVEDMGITCLSPTTPCPAADQRRNFRITSRASGGTPNSLVMLQSIYQMEMP